MKESIFTSTSTSMMLSHWHNHFSKVTSESKIYMISYFCLDNVDDNSTLVTLLNFPCNVSHHATSHVFKKPFLRQELSLLEQNEYLQAYWRFISSVGHNSFTYKDMEESVMCRFVVFLF